MQRAFLAAVGMIATAALLLTALPSSGAEAHADLVRAEPEIDSRVATSPAQLVLHFSQEVKQVGSFIQIEDASGNRPPLEVAFDPTDGKVMIAKPVSPLVSGVYKVHWQTLSAGDDDFHDGEYELTILNPDGSEPDGVPSSIGSDEDGQGKSGESGTTILIAVMAPVLIGIGGLGFYLRSLNGRAAG